MRRIAQEFDALQEGILGVIFTRHDIADEQRAVVREQAPKLGQRPLGTPPVVGAVTGDHEIEALVLEGQVFHVGQLGDQIVQAGVSRQQLGLLQHGGSEIAGDNQARLPGEGGRCVARAAAGVQYARLGIWRCRS